MAGGEDPLEVAKGTAGDAMTSGLYRPDLAFVHHEGFGDFARGAAAGILSWLREAAIGDGHVVDLGCGSGIAAAELTRAGYDVLGVDSSAAMIELARATAPEARFEVASVYGFLLPRCRAVLAMGEVLCYLPPTRVAPPLLDSLFRIAGALEPEGMLAFDVLVSVGPPMTYESTRVGDGWEVHVAVSELAEEGLLRRVITTRRDGEEAVECRESTA